MLGLGKLGSEELNYSSDVDLVYVFEAKPAAGVVHGGPSELGPLEYFTRLAHEFGRRVASPSPEGFLYRVDLGLRPEGDRGPLVAPSDWLAVYCDSWAATWEQAAWMKARPVAGDLGFGWDVVRSLAPALYRSTMDYAGVEGIKSMKRRIERELLRPGEDFNVKLGPGGIRDVEFVVQALQLLHGGRILQVRERSTQRALTSLAECGVLEREQAEGLLASYRFLRRVENRLQMREERQTHRIPSQPEPPASGWPGRSVSEDLRPSRPSIASSRAGASVCARASMFSSRVRAATESCSSSPGEPHACWRSPPRAR